MVYSYKKSRALSKIRGTCRLLGLDYYYVKDKALIRGQLQTLFGKPLYTGPDVENQYGYVVIMENDEGAQYALHVYSAKFGPSIGGNSDVEGIEDATQELKQYISKAVPSDYQYEGIYKDKLRIIMGVKNGDPYYSSIDIATGQIVNGMDVMQKYEKLFEEVGWIAKWEARGRAKGREEGREEGEEQKVLAIAQNLINLGLPAETVISATGLDPERVKVMYHTNSK